MKKTKEWLETLDKKYRDKALKNMTKADDLHSTLAGAVSNGFVWDDTPEGHDFWNGVFRELMWGKKFEVTDKTKSDEIVKVPKIQTVSGTNSLPLKETLMNSNSVENYFTTKKVDL